MAEWVMQHAPCPCGQSSDAFSINDEGWGTCFSCDKRFPPDKHDGEGSPDTGAATKPPSDLIKPGEIKALGTRKLTEETCRKFGYSVSHHKGKTVQVAPYRDRNGRLVAQKIRDKNKEMMTRGEFKDVALFGQHLWKTGGKRVVITEGEIDAIIRDTAAEHGADDGVGPSPHVGDTKRGSTFRTLFTVARVVSGGP